MPLLIAASTRFDLTCLRQSVGAWWLVPTHRIAYRLVQQTNLARTGMPVVASHRSLCMLTHSLTHTYTCSTSAASVLLLAFRNTCGISGPAALTRCRLRPPVLLAPVDSYPWMLVSGTFTPGRKAGSLLPLPPTGVHARHSLLRISPRSRGDVMG